ncbi:MFS transporter [Nocardiopsis sp. NPDC006832]|uniref:MFS transporter n=1 Tax=Nocardiopsis sp. NPDC006832 TaxID=3157188 RepID=UPI0033D73981
MRENPLRAGRAAWLGLAVLTLPIFMMANDVSVLFLALPAIGADLQPQATQSLWILHVGELLGAGLVLTMGRLGDRVGRRRLLLIGLAAYAASSTLAAFSPDPATLIVARALIGASVATISPSTLSLLRSMFPDPGQFATAVALNLSAFSVGMALGPPLGGLLLEFFWWGSLFLVNVPVALLALVTLPFLLPEYRDPNPGRMDVPSVLSSTVALVLLVYGLQELAAQGSRPSLLAAVVVGSALLWWFVRRQRRLKDPLMDPGMFARPIFVLAVTMCFLMLLAAAGTDLFLVQYLQSVLGISPGLVGALLIVPAVAGFVGTMLTPVLIRFLTTGVVVGGGMLVAVSGLATILWGAGTGSAWPLILGTTVTSIGGAPAMTLGSQLALSSVPMERTGSASAVTDVAAGLGQTLGLALMGSLGLLVYRTSLSGAFTGDVPEAARGSIGGALATADDLGSTAGAALREAAASAFGLGLQVTAGAGGVLLAVAAVVMMAVLRGHRANEPEEAVERVG